MFCLLASVFRCRRLLVVVVAATLSAVAFAQQSGSSTPSSPPPPDKKTAKKVWTEEELRRIRSGSVSVVGESVPPAESTEASGDAEEEKAAKPEASPAGEPAGRVQPPPCKNKSWAAAVHKVLAAQGVDLGADYWEVKCYGASVCTTEMGNVAALAGSIQGDYVLDDGKKVRIQANPSTRLPGSEAFIAVHDQGRAFLVVWKKHPYVTSGFTKQRIVYSAPPEVGGGTKVEYLVDSFDLMDPYEGRQVTIREKADLDHIEAVVELLVTKP